MKYPISVQDFRTLIEDNYVYVDKTDAVSSAADGLGDVIEGTVTTGTKVRVTATTLGKSLWKLIWKVVNG